MKHLFNNLSEEVKKEILEQHYGGKEIVSEQLRGVGSQVGARVKQAAKSVGTTAQRIGTAVGGKQDMGKNAGLESKITYVKNTSKTFYNNILTTSNYLKKSKSDPSKMGNYADEATKFNEKIDAITAFMDDMATQFNSKLAELKIDYKTSGAETQSPPQKQSTTVV